MSNITRYVWGEYDMYKDTCGDYVDAKEYDRLTAQLADRDAEIVKLKYELKNAEDGALQLLKNEENAQAENITLRTKLTECEKEVKRWKKMTPTDAIAFRTTSVKEARKQAAMEIMMHLLGMFWTIPYKENEPMMYRDQAIEWLRDKFGLEG